MPESVFAKLFTNGRSQAVRLPREFRFPGTRVRIHREGARVILESTYDNVEEWFAALDAAFSNEPFMPEGRKQPPMPGDDDVPSFDVPEPGL